jgi:hypothetical protein
MKERGGRGYMKRRMKRRLTGRIRKRKQNR